MRNVARKIMRILDGSPGAGGLTERGQSLIELAFITPLLIIMFVGIVEIGWYANHLLILMEVTRVGARNGTLASGSLSPLNWVESPADHNPTIHPIAYILDNGYLNNTSPSAAYRAAGGQSTAEWLWNGTGTNVNALPATIPSEAVNYRQPCADLQSKQIGFYNLIVCAMLNSMDPLQLNGRAANTTSSIMKTIPTPRSTGYIKVPYPDDIVISVFALEMINNDNPAPWADNPATKNVVEGNAFIYSHSFDFKTNTFSALDDNYQKGFRVRVVGRYPTTANECNVRWQPTFAPSDGDNYIGGATGAAYSPANTTLDVGQTLIERIMGPLAYDNKVGTTETVTAPSWPIPAGTFVYQQFPTMIDPFDFIPDKARNSANGRYIELAGYDEGAEIQRGYVYTGQHVVRDVDSSGAQTFCLGSEWSNDKVENLMNTPGFLMQGVTLPPGGNFNDAAWQTCCKARYDEWQAQAQYLPSQGVVLVEMFWSHNTLMDFPFMRPIVTMFGDPQRITISVWAAFPVPSVEPNLIFNVP